MTPRQPFHRIPAKQQRRGVALAAVIVLTTISLTLFALWAQASVREHRRMAGRQFRVQAVLLAEAGLQRAIARRAADPAYSSETWAVPASELSGGHAAEVRIQVSPAIAGDSVAAVAANGIGADADAADGAAPDATADAADRGTILFQATAIFPADPVRRVQYTKRLELPQLPARNEP